MKVNQLVQQATKKLILNRLATIILALVLAMLASGATYALLFEYHYNLIATVLAVLIFVLCLIIVAKACRNWPSIESVSTKLDRELNTKDRITSYQSLSDGQKDSRADYLERQLAGTWNQVAYQELTAFKFSKLEFVTLAILAGLTIITGLLYFSIDNTKLNQQVVQLEKLITELKSNLPEEVVGELNNLVENIQKNGLSSEETIASIKAAKTAIAAAQKELKTKAGSEQEKSAASDAAPEASSSPSPSPSPSSNEEKDKDNQEEQKKEDDQNSEQSETGSGSSQGEKSDDQNAKAEEQNQEGSGKGAGEKEAAGEQGQGEQQSEQNESGGQGKSDSKNDKSDESSGTSQSDSSKQGNENQGQNKEQDIEQSREGEDSESSENNQKSEGNKEGQKEGQSKNGKKEGTDSKQGNQENAKERALDSAKQALDNLENQSDGANSGKSGEAKPEEKLGDQNKTDSSESGEKGEKEGKEQQSQNQASRPGKNNNSPPGKSTDEPPPGDSNDGFSGAALEGGLKKIDDEGADQDGRALDKAEGFEDVTVSEKSENFDTSQTGTESKLEKGEGGNEYKTSLEDIELIKPEAENSGQKQEIPLEYREVIK